MAERIAFIGFGEAGQTISRGFAGDTKPAIRAYDILFGQPAGVPLEAAAKERNLPARFVKCATCFDSAGFRNGATASCSVRGCPGSIPSIRKSSRSSSAT